MVGELLEKDGAVLDGLDAKLINIVAQVLEERVGEGDLEEAELDEEHLAAEEVEVLGNGLLVLLDDGVHLLILELDEGDPQFFDEGGETI
jgi:hypothetical protein